MVETAKPKNIAINSRVFLGLGSNLAFGAFEPKEIIAKAIAALTQNGIAIVAVSSIYQSKAWPLGNGNPDYLNCIVEIAVDFENPFELLEITSGIEAALGRARQNDNQWAARTIDIDIIDFRGQLLDAAQNGRKLNLPHARLSNRSFVLLPLKEIAPNWCDPRSKMHINSLIDGLGVLIGDNDAIRVCNA